MFTSRSLKRDDVNAADQSSLGIYTEQMNNSHGV